MSFVSLFLEEENEDMGRNLQKVAELLLWSIEVFKLQSWIPRFVRTHIQIEFLCE